RDLRLSLREHFRERAAEYNRVVFDSGQPCTALCGDVFALESRSYDVVYLDPPYAPPRDDNCYIKRYHFLEGLSVYWRGQAIMEDTRTKKLPKRYTPFSYKHTVTGALRRMLKQFQDSAIVLSYSSNAVPDADTLEGLLREVKNEVEVRLIDHTYTFGTHSTAQRRAPAECLSMGRYPPCLTSRAVAEYLASLGFGLAGAGGLVAAAGPNPRSGEGIAVGAEGAGVTGGCYSVLPALPPTGPKPAPPGRWLLPFGGGAHVHVAEQPVSPHPDERGTRAPRDGSDPQFAVAEHVEPGVLDLHPFCQVSA